jgi:hypothetical protein
VPPLKPAGGILPVSPRPEAGLSDTAQSDGVRSFGLPLGCAEMENAGQDWAWPALPRRASDDSAQTPAADIGAYPDFDQGRDRDQHTPQVGGRSSFGWAASPERSA